ncbi:MAG: hypothetical protein RLZZ490_1749 [Cyanobacteriota bacterium]|jgi:predicted deacylase
MQPWIETIPFLTLASGDRLNLTLYRYQGSQPGKKCYVQANLHGGEIVGNGVIYELMQWLDQLPAGQLKGEICLVPVCNPLGTNQRSHFFATGRYNPYDGRDWNRIFWDYEKHCPDLPDFVRSQWNLDVETIQANFRARQRQAFEAAHQSLQTSPSAPWREQYRYILQSLCLDADYVLDLHSSSNQSLPYVYCFASRENSGSWLGFDYGILMTTYDGDAFDEAFMKPWLGLEQEFSRQGRSLQFDVEAYTLELGSGMTLETPMGEQAMKGIINFWAAKGLLSLPNYEIFSHATQYGDRRQMVLYYAPSGGFVRRRVDLKQPVQQGDILYELLQFQDGFPTKLIVTAESKGMVFDVGINQSVNQGEYVLSLWKSEDQR